MEIHRRILIRELILILANTGIRAPSEILSLKWGDIEIKKEKLALYTDKNTGKPIEEDQLIAYIKLVQNTKLLQDWFKVLQDDTLNDWTNILEMNLVTYRRRMNLYSWSSMVDESLIHLIDTRCIECGVN